MSLAKNENFWHFFFEKCQVFGNYLTAKWQLPGRSDSYPWSYVRKTYITCVVAPHGKTLKNKSNGGTKEETAIILISGTQL